jgi:cobalamin biosynthetic protein CobC
VARHALADTVWQTRMRQELSFAAQRLAALLAPLGEIASTELFATVTHQHPAQLFEHFARRAILIRRFDAHGLLRFGLPANDTEWQRLAQAINEWTHE